MNKDNANMAMKSLLPAEFSDASMVETHISVVFLSEDLVFKFKKPVRFDFIDMSTLEKRWNACIQEVKLNRRLAPETYLGVLPLFSDRENSIENVVDCYSDSTLAHPDGISEAVVVMKRLPEAQQLQNLVAVRECREEVLQLGTLLFDFHREQHISSSAIDTSDFINSFISRCRDNFAVFTSSDRAVLSSSAQHALKISEEYTENVIKDDLREMLQDRCRGKEIVDGHGDLRAEHIYLGHNKIFAIDCLEFNEELRIIDALNDLAFLCMDLERLKRADLSFFLEQAYDAEHDSRSRNLIPFYKAYRAMVRAKVAYLKVSQQEESSSYAITERYLALASRYALGLEKPWIIALGGLMGSGKSTLANHICGITDATVLSSDEIREELFSKNAADKQLHFGEGKYAEEGKNATYKLLFSKAELLANHDNSIILDASFMNVEHREEAYRLARKHDCNFLFVYCDANKAILEQRLERRSREGGSDSDGRKELLEKQMDAFESIDELGSIPTLVVSTEQEIVIQSISVITELKKSGC